MGPVRALSRLTDLLGLAWASVLRKLLGLAQALVSMRPTVRSIQRSSFAKTTDTLANRGATSINNQFSLSGCRLIKDSGLPDAAAHRACNCAKPSQIWAERRDYPVNTGSNHSLQSEYLNEIAHLRRLHHNINR
jgi:hypothetical protein